MLNQKKIFQSYLKPIQAILIKDILAEVRSQEIVIRMVIFSITLIVIFNYTLQETINSQIELSTGLIWIVFIFAGIIGINRSMTVEIMESCIEGLLVTPASRTAIYWGKVISGLLFMLLTEIIVIPIFSLLYSIHLMQIKFIILCVLGSLGFICIGTLLSLLSLHSRGREVLLSILFFPLALPVLIASIKASSEFLVSSSSVGFYFWLQTLIAYDLIILALFFIFSGFIDQE